MAWWKRRLRNSYRPQRRFLRPLGIALVAQNQSQVVQRGSQAGTFESEQLLSQYYRFTRRDYSLVVPALGSLLRSHNFQVSPSRQSTVPTCPCS